jgi:hypothetical protein
MKILNPEQLEQDSRALEQLSRDPAWQVVLRYAAELTNSKQRPFTNKSEHGKLREKGVEQYAMTVNGIAEYCQGISDLVTLPQRVQRQLRLATAQRPEKEKNDE